MSGGKKRPEESVGDLLAGFLKQRGLEDRVAQASIIPEWSELVGAQVAAVAEPRSITADGTLFVWVSSNAWMNELSMMQPELLRALNRDPSRPPIKRIRLLLKRAD